MGVQKREKSYPVEGVKKGYVINKQTNEQNKSRDLEIKSKLTVTRGDGGGGYCGKEGEEESKGT